MVVINRPCKFCKFNYRQLENGEYGCDAYPNGFPLDFLKKILREVDVRTIPECGNGYKWTPKEDTTE